MKRPAGTSSLAVETRRLLRHLDAPKRLRHNALVSHLFDDRPEEIVLAAIHAIVHRALDAMVDRARYAKRQRAQRFREIVTRFDLNGEPAHAVAHDLGLSLRHFYRERNAACVEIGTLLERFLPQRPSDGSVSSLYEISEAAAHGIALAGAPMQAALQFLSLAAEVTDPRARIAALCDAAMLMTELYDPTGARTAVAEAARLLDGTDGLSTIAETEARTIIDFTRALALWDNGSQNATALALHTMEQAHRYITELSATGLRLHAGERLRYAGRRIAEGDLVDALRLLHDSEPFIDLLGQRAPYLRVDYANVRCGIELRVSQSWDEAAHLASRAYDESRKQGYLIGAASAARSMALILANRGDMHAAELAEAMLQLARNNHSPRLLAYAQIGAANVYNLAGAYDRALALTRDAIGLLHDEPLQLERARHAEMEALHGLRAVERRKNDILVT